MAAGFAGLLATAGSARAQTDFGVRVLGAAASINHRELPDPRPMLRPSAGLAGAALVGGHYGRITSLMRSAAHNRAVGGVPNSYHLRGRAIDIARRPGVTHAMIAAALRSAGYQLVESLDEGDHSHFAFGFGGTAPVTIAAIHEVTRWGIILAPRT
ncbi:MAG: D-Ala-D-Ala carboxypeptidase family metallohydrolase [Sphingomicrobium sp.]